MPEQSVYETAEELEQAIDRYFSHCLEEGVFPDEAGMMLFLGISRETLESYLADRPPEEGGGGFATPILCARTRRESMLVRDIYRAKEMTGKLFLAKQASNGGLQDKPKEDNAVVIDIKFKGSPEDFA